MSILVVIALFLAFVYIRWFHKRNSASLPPGPKPTPVLGNLRDLTVKEMWLPATQWAKEYGDVVHVQVLGQHLVFLNTYEAAVELLERRGNIYSDKPRLIMAGELCGLEHMVPFARYGDAARRHRRIMNRALSAKVVVGYQPLFEVEAHALLQRLISDPANFREIYRRYTAGSSLSFIYGYHVASVDDPLIEIANESMDTISTKIVNNIGIWAVDILPFLRHLPLWFPGAGFKRSALVWKAQIREFADKPFEFVKQNTKDGLAASSFCSMLLDDIPEKAAKELLEQMEMDIRWTAASMYLASIDTVVTALLHFTLAVLDHPEVLKKAQAEIDAVVGLNRLPNFKDRPSLPYIDCIMSEVLRWAVPVPLSLLHRVMDDDVYNGMHIPKDTLIFPNIWRMLRDEELYPEPHTFNPDRFLVQSDEATMKRKDPRNVCFGFGRRRCPGVHLVESSIWIVLASMIATLDITKAKDKQGKLIDPEIHFDNPVFRTPSEFACNIRPRSSQATKVVREAADAAGSMCS